MMKRAHTKGVGSAYETRGVDCWMMSKRRLSDESRDIPDDIVGV